MHHHKTPPQEDTSPRQHNNTSISSSSSPTLVDVAVDHPVDLLSQLVSDLSLLGLEHLAHHTAESHSVRESFSEGMSEWARCVRNWARVDDVAAAMQAVQVMSTVSV